MIGKIVLILEKIACGEQLSTGETGNYVETSKSEEGWTTHEKMEIEDLKLSRSPFNKYQRRRIPWEDVVAIDNMIEDS